MGYLLKSRLVTTSLFNRPDTHSSESVTSQLSQNSPRDTIMGAGLSRQNENESLPWEFTWTVSALVALSNISKELQREFGQTDKRSGCLRNIEVSAWFLQGHLQDISITEAENMMEDIRRLVGPLNTIFNIAQLSECGSHVRF